MTNSEDIFRLELSLLEERCFPYNDLYLENESVIKLGDSVRNFFQGIKEMLLKAIDLISDKIHKKFKEKETSEKLDQIRKACRSAQAKGLTTVACYDIFSYQKILKETVDHLDRVISRYVKGYDRRGKGLAATDKMVDDVNRIIKESDEKLKKIKEKKVQINIQKLINWLDKQTKNGNRELFDFANEYMKKLDEYTKIADQYDKKADAFAEKNKVYRRPKGITQSLTNASAFIKRNIDWVGNFALAIAGTQIGIIFDELSAQKNIRRHNEETNFGDRGSGSLLQSPSANEKRGRLETSEQYGEKKLHNVATVGKAVAAVTTPLAGTNMIKAKHDRRNSV